MRFLTCIGIAMVLAVASVSGLLLAIRIFVDKVLNCSKK